jgi:uncharacterized protein YkwD
MRTLRDRPCRARMRRGCLLLTGLLLGAGCDGEDPVAQTDSDATITTMPPAITSDAAQVAMGSDSAAPGAVDADARVDASSLGDAAFPSSDAGRPGDGGTAPPARDASAPGSDAQTPPSNSEICARWKAERADLKEGSWSGSVDTCTAGELSADGIANALRVFNLYRSMVGLAPLTNDAEANKRAQGCALLMAANGTISHTPPTTWKCYSAEGAATASSSSLSTGPSVSSVDGYMLDPGNSNTMGHRRWVLSNYLASVGFGSAGRFSCQYQPPKQGAGGGAAAKPWVAWPSPGQVPLQVFKQRGGSLDTIGWSIQSDSINFAPAQVTVTRAGTMLPVTIAQLPTGYGSRYALRIAPQGWTSEAGAKYDVSITGISTPISYSVEVVNCAP